VAEGQGPIDPFAEGDPAAAEREARRRAREQRRAQRPKGQGDEGGAGARRSLGERVSGALGGLGSSEEPPSAGPAGTEPGDRSEPEPRPAPVAPPDQPAQAPEPAEAPEPSPEPAADSREFFAMPREVPGGGGRGGGDGGLGGEMSVAG
jgi:hypothetical protein